MKITSSIEYATRIMVSLSRGKEGAKFSAERLSEIENISVDYVTQLLQRLRRGGLVDSSRGPVGGYSLSRKPSEVSLGDVIRAVDGKIFEEVCSKYETGPKDCGQQTRCSLSPVWRGLRTMIEDYFDRIDLSRFAGEDASPEPSSGGRPARSRSFEV